MESLQSNEIFRYDMNNERSIIVGPDTTYDLDSLKKTETYSFRNRISLMMSIAMKNPNVKEFKTHNVRREALCFIINKIRKIKLRQLFIIRILLGIYKLKGKLPKLYLIRYLIKYKLHHLIPQVLSEFKEYTIFSRTITIDFFILHQICQKFDNLVFLKRLERTFNCRMTGTICGPVVLRYNLDKSRFIERQIEALYIHLSGFDIQYLEMLYSYHPKESNEYLMEAAYNGNLECLKFWLEKGVRLSRSQVLEAKSWSFSGFYNKRALDIAISYSTRG